MKPVRISAVQFAVNPTLIYRHQATATHDLVATKQEVVFEDVDPDCTSFAVHPEVLSFGLLEDMCVSSSGADATSMYSILLAKETGNRQSAWVSFGESVSVTGAELAASDDARHADIGQVWTATGHDMRFRMIASAAIANLTVLMSGTVPAKVSVSFTGANAIPASVALSDAVSTVAARKPLPFLMGPIPMKKRLTGAVQTMKDAL
jgi:hypothetical protein